MRKPHPRDREDLKKRGRSQSLPNRRRFRGGLSRVLYIFPSQMISLKKELYQQCLDHVQKRIEAAELAIAEAQNASNDDTKSSAGDKYETGREMAQQETNRNLAQLNEASKLRIALNQVSTTTITDQAGLGSLVFTNNGNFYMAISAGILTVDGQTWMAISPASPIGQALKGLKAGQQFNLNNKIYLLNKVF